MQKLLFSIAFSIICLGSLSAQTFIGKINPFPSESNKPVVKASGQLRILAAMVEFQQDKDGSTVGNGKFGSIYSKDYGKTILDPLPFDQSYFSAHLEFAKNYYQKVSGGKLNITYTVLPQVFTVSKTIRDFAPVPKSNDFTGLGDFSKEVWAKADSANPGFDFSNYDVFIIFHAGVGRDVTLPGSLGNERDMPSVYLSLNGLQKIYGSAFTGFPVSGGNSKITNSMILPCTESREISSFGTTYLFQITINGLLVSSIGSYLGLPDLFDTKTGLTAIGRFGLMDGQSIFAYMGVFPPQPSAWEKIYMGWATPVIAAPDKLNYSVSAQLAATASDTLILKVPINSSEYFLVENRNRDVNKDGAKVTYTIDGVSYTKTFLKDTTFFYSAGVDSLKGVITDVDEYDWAAPGNGIVIWHIDDNIINSQIADNKINADKTKRGIDVEEADGIQDIGEQFTTVFGDVVTGEGTDEDFWFSGNTAKLYKGRFDKNSRPNSNSNSGANSLVSIYNFSALSNKMSFNVAYGDSLIKPAYSAKIPATTSPVKLSFVSQGDEGKIIALVNTDLFVYKLGTPDVFSTMSGFSNYKPTIFSSPDNVLVIGTYLDKLNNRAVLGLLQFNRNLSRGILRYDSDEFISSPYIYTDKSDGKEYVTANCKSSNDFIMRLPLSYIDIQFDTQKKQNQFSVPVYKNIDSKEGYSSYLLANSIANSNGKKSTVSSLNPKDMVMFKDSKGRYISAVLNAGKEILLFDNDEVLIKTIPILNPDSLLSQLALGDLKNDGENYIIYNNGKNIEAVNPSGAMALNFPFVDPLGIGFSGTPLVYDFAGDKKPEIISATKDGRIYAIDGGTGKVVTGFPISTGAALNSVPVAFTLNGQAMLAATSGDNLNAWVIGSTTNNPIWGEENGNSQNNSYTSSASKSDFVNTFFPSEKVYNYPNPAYDNLTYIRYYVSEDSKVNIKIFDIAGDFVAELNNNAQGGMENETAWKLNNIQSGVYLARVEATSASGKTESKVIKIAVVK